jgi:hypothetical protein
MRAGSTIIPRGLDMITLLPMSAAGKTAPSSPGLTLKASRRSG